MTYVHMLEIQMRWKERKKKQKNESKEKSKRKNKQKQKQKRVPRNKAVIDKAKKVEISKAGQIGVSRF